MKPSTHDILEMVSKTDKSDLEKCILAYKIGKIAGMKEQKKIENKELFSTIGG